MKIGIVGLPNVGKSTLFKALTKKQVDIANFPFCTIGPNVGIVKVPDERLELLSRFSASLETIPVAIEFVDIAGLVRGAHNGEGLGNQFLAHIREVDAIVQVIRVFEDEHIIHVEGAIEPLHDIETIEIELIFADMATVEKRYQTLFGQLKSGSTPTLEVYMVIIKNIITCLENGKPASTLHFSEEEEKYIQDLHLLTRKPILYLLNTDESGEVPSQHTNLLSYLSERQSLQLCVKLEAELSELSSQEVLELGFTRTGLDRLIVLGYALLQLITYFTTGPKETRAWTIKNSTKAPQAAGVIHSDFERGFIRAEVINWKDLLDAGSEMHAKEKGLIRLEGKEYSMKDGDCCLFRFQV